jgi:GTP pyrophosphokinase
VVGDTCVGAKINGRLAPLRTPLANGDQVDIITSKAQTPSPTWERFVVTGKARARIRRFIRISQRQEYLDLGQAMIEKAFAARGGTYTSKVVEPLVRQFGQANVEDLAVAVGQGNVSVGDVVKAALPGAEIIQAPPKKKKDDGKRAKKDGKDGAIQLKGLIPGMAVHFARCCHPLPGDRIVGIITTGKGVTIHTIDCATLESFSESPERWIDVGWDSVSEGAPGIYTGRLKVTVANQPGSLSKLSTVIARHEGNISNLRIVNRSMDFFDMVIDVEVSDVKHLADITAALRATPAINAVERARN